MRLLRSVSFVSAAVSCSLNSLICKISIDTTPALQCVVAQVVQNSCDEAGAMKPPQMTQSLTSVSQIVGPPLAGLLIEHNLLTGWGLAVAAVALLGLVMASRPVVPVEAHA